MNLKHLILAIAISLANSEYVNYKGYKVYKVVPESEKDVNVLKEIEQHGVYQFWTDTIKVGNDVRIMVPPSYQLKFGELLETMDADGKVVIEDVQKLIDIQSHRSNKTRSNYKYDWTHYQTYEEINQWMEDIVAEHSDVAEIITIGSTIEGRPIRGVIIDYKKETHKNVGVLEGGIHAREWISPATVTFIINEFLTSNDPEIRALAENIVWHLFPVVNPDGYVYTFTNNRMWRKNRNPVSSMSCAQWGISDDLSNGIDLNRNFGFLWMTTGASSISCSEIYAGPTANSEAETLALINHIEAIKSSENNHLVYYFAFHSFAQMVLVPYSHVSGADVLEAPNYADMYEIAVRGMVALKKRNNIDYVVGTSGDILYYVSGSSFDWMKGVANIPIVYLFELRDDGDFGFLLPPSLIIPNNKEIMDALLEMDKTTRQLGYYHRNNGVIFNLNILTLFMSFMIIR